MSSISTQTSPRTVKNDEHLVSLLKRAIDGHDVYTAVAVAKTLGERQGLRDLARVLSTRDMRDAGPEYRRSMGDVMGAIAGRLAGTGDTW